jgi:N-acetylglucosamine-6-phosphate deacetylase
MIEKLSREFTETSVLTGTQHLRIAISKTGTVMDVAETDALSLTDAPFVTLGFFDLQVNGFAGVDFNAPGLTPEAMDVALEGMLASGVTKCLPTIISASPDWLVDRFRALEHSVRHSRLGPYMVAGYHLEGPFISPDDGYRGCHPASAICAADITIFERVQKAAGGQIRLVSLAPEVTGALELIDHLRRAGICVALAHTAAGRSQIREAVDRGACLSTHLGNATPHLLEKRDNVIIHQLGDDRLQASFIADGHHLPVDILKLYLRAKGVSRSILVSDATAAASAPTGNYTLGEVSIARGPDAVVRLPGTPYLAGSALGLDQALRNLIAWLDIDLADVSTMAGINPRNLLFGHGPAVRANAPVELVWWEPTDTGPYVSAAQVGPFHYQRNH